MNVLCETFVVKKKIWEVITCSTHVTPCYSFFRALQFAPGGAGLITKSRDDV